MRRLGEAAADGEATLLTVANAALREAIGGEEGWIGAVESAEPSGAAGWAELRSSAPAHLVLRVPIGKSGPFAEAFLQVVAHAVNAARAEQARVEAELRAAAAEAFFREVIGPMPIGVLVRRGPLMQVTHANAAVERMVKRNIPVGQMRDYPDMAQAGLYRIYDGVLRTGQPVTVRAFRYKVELPELSTGERFADLMVLPLRGADGEIDGTALFAVDVTDQVQQKRAVEVAEQRQRQLLQSIQAIVWEAPYGGGPWTYVSEGAVPMLGYPLSRWLEPGFWRSILHSEDRERVIASSGAAAGDHELEYRVLAADGRAVWLHDAVRVIRDAAGRVVAQRGVMLDITARREAEAERTRIQSEMVEVQKLESLGVMAGGIAHDFNNLLTVILGNASLASMRLPERSSARASIDDLIVNAQRAADLTRQLLAYSGRAQLTSETLDLGHLVRELRGLMAASLPKSATLEVDLDPMVPAVEGDPTQLQQVVMNLTTNAAEALADRPGRVSVSTSFVTLTGDEATSLGLVAGAFVTLTVRDDGCGMAPAIRKRIFDPFFTTKAQGRGLGLAAVHGIVRGHRGAIDVRSKEDVGSAFTVYLPATSVRPQPRPPRPTTIRSGTGLILVIDDEAEVRATARAMLEALGYDVLEAEDGRAGLLTFDRQRKEIRAVLLDMTMPVMSGEEVYRELRLRDKQVRIVLSTGYTQIDARRRGMLEGIRGFLQKPYTVRQLSETMAQALAEVPGAPGE